MDKAKIEIIKKLSPPTSMKGVRCFLGHADFYRRFIRDFSKISKPLSTILLQGIPSNFDNACATAFKSPKKKLILASIIIAPD